MDNGLKLALEHFKTRHALAKALDVWRSAVYKWKRIPAQHCMRTAELIGRSAAEVRPDIFDPQSQRHLDA